MQDRASAIIAQFQLEAHPEGGAYRRVYSTPIRAAASERAAAGSIYFLLRGEEISHLHRIDCDEIWYYHEGCGMRVTSITPGGALHTETLGLAYENGDLPMLLLPKGTIFAAENLDKQGYSFASCMTAPQFHYDGFELFSKAELLALYPQYADEIKRLAMPESF